VARASIGIDIELKKELEAQKLILGKYITWNHFLELLLKCYKEAHEYEVKA